LEKDRIVTPTKEVENHASKSLPAINEEGNLLIPLIVIKVALSIVLIKLREIDLIAPKAKGIPIDLKE